ncbi:hypothetical protein Fmac_016925 [Flemingia macrophylla]|uniref:Uncharacterized protein n=1 Tax=Flemingia macrophylla TaxID=520843 RepID=A0ABD1MIR8_9FABA
MTTQKNNNNKFTCERGTVVVVARTQNAFETNSSEGPLGAKKTREVLTVAKILS